MQYWLRKRHKYCVMPIMTLHFVREGKYALYNITTGNRVCEVRKNDSFWRVPVSPGLYRTPEEITERGPLIETYWSLENGLV